MEEMKKRYETVNYKLKSLDTRMDTMRRDQAESSCARTVKQPGTRVNFAEMHHRKQEYSPDAQYHILALDAQYHRIGNSKNSNKRRRININESPKVIKHKRECSTRYHDMGKHLAND